MRIHMSSKIAWHGNLSLSLHTKKNFIYTSDYPASEHMEICPQIKGSFIKPVKRLNKQLIMTCENLKSHLFKNTWKIVLWLIKKKEWVKLNTSACYILQPSHHDKSKNKHMTVNNQSISISDWSFCLWFLFNTCPSKHEK